MRKTLSRRSSRRPRSNFFKLCFVDHQSRWKHNVYVILLVFLYGVLNTVVLSRPERQVSFEALTLAFFITVILSIFYKPSAEGRLPNEGFAKGRWVQFLWLGSKTRIAAMIAAIFILVGNAVPLDAVEPSIAVWRIENSSMGIVPGLTPTLHDKSPVARFQATSKAADERLAQRGPLPPSAVQAVKQSLQKTVENIRLPQSVKNAANSEIVSLQGYETFGAAIARQTASRSGERFNVEGIVLDLPPSASSGIVTTGPAFFSSIDIHGTSPEFFPQHNQAIVVTGGGNVTVFDGTINGLTQDIGGMTWIDGTFENSRITYSGQPLFLANVRFVNCQYDFAPDEVSQQVLKYIRQYGDEPVSLVAPLNPR